MTNAHLMFLTCQMLNIDIVFPSPNTSEKILLSHGRSKHYHVKIKTAQILFFLHSYNFLNIEENRFPEPVCALLKLLGNNTLS